MKIKTVAILGAGAIGAYFIWGMSEKLGENLWVVADGERRERLLRDGIRINGKRYELHVRTPQAIIGCGVGAYRDSEYMKLISRRLREEVTAVAAAKGIEISSRGQTAVSSRFADSKRARYSTLQDLDNKRHTEVDMFAGAMVRMGKELGIPTPYCEYTYCAIKALEEKNDGKFDYE